LKGLVLIPLITLCLICLGSCNDPYKAENVEARIIKYKIEYLADNVGGIPTSILPHKMDLIFADQFAMNTIEGFMGQFSLSYVADLDEKTVITFLKIFDHKYFYRGKAGELPAGIDPMPGLDIIKGSGKTIIAGFEANELILKRPGKKDFSIYSTDEIDIESPNITTPYKEQDEVLLKFYTVLSKMEMVLTAEKYSEEEISTDIFFIPEGYKKVSRETMEKAINELFK
jgi:hypothetical protein